MDFLNSSLFQALFNTRVPKVILKADVPDFTIVHYNEAYEIATYNIDNDIRGKSLWAAYNPEDAGGEGSTLLPEALTKAVINKEHVHMPPFHYDIPDENGDITNSWWQLEITPVLENDNSVSYLLVTTNNITQQILNQQQIDEATRREQILHEELSAANEELTASNEELSATIEELSSAEESLNQLNRELEARVIRRTKSLSDTESSLRSLVMTAHYPLMILRGREWVIEIANQPLVDLWDKTIAEVTGKTLMEILPELEGQPFPGFLRQVYDSGVGYGQEEQIFHYNSPSGPAQKYVSFYYDPMLNDEGVVCGIIVAADDITEKVKSRHLLEQNIRNLAESESRFRSLISQAPVGICVIRASDLMVQEVNDSYLELVGKQREEVEHITIWDAVAEAAENYAPILNEVIISGIPFIAKEHEVILIRNGIDETVFIDFVYEPVKAIDGIVTAVMVVAIEVSDKVLARRNIEDVEERVRLAVEATEIGTFDHDLETDLMVTSERFDRIFGFDEPVSRAELRKVIHPEDINIGHNAQQEAYANGHMFYDARVIHQDRSIHWIRVQGKVYYDGAGKPLRVLGTILDITDFKNLQQQKDDFISIASHELKTPLTSLKASLQLLERLKDKPDSQMLPKLIDQSGKSMNKISELVDDLLNVTRMSQGQITLNRTHFNIARVLNECCNHVRIAGQHELIFQGDAALEVYADEHRIDQVIVNFVNNAVKYAPESKVICLIVEELSDSIRIAVKDQGAGVPPEKLPHLFDRYYRADTSGQQVSGLGLGLYISAEIIKRHGGEIGVDSEVNAGSTFWFTLPK